MFNLIVGIQLGILVYFVIKAKHHIQHKTFSPSVWWAENSMRLIYSSLVGVLVSLLVQFYPESLVFIQWAGINLEGQALSNLSPVILGGLLAAYAYSPSKNKPEAKTGSDVE